MIQRRSLATYILLSIVTCGIYSIYFWYKFVEDTNQICYGDGKETPNYIVVILLSLITCGFYSFYFFYNLGNRLSENGPRYGLNFTENGTTVLIWQTFGSLLCGLGLFVSYNILINNMNNMGERFNNNMFNNQNNQGYGQDFHQDFNQ